MTSIIAIHIARKFPLRFVTNRGEDWSHDWTFIDFTICKVRCVRRLQRQSAGRKCKVTLSVTRRDANRSRILQRARRDKCVAYVACM